MAERLYGFSMKDYEEIEVEPCEPEEVERLAFENSERVRRYLAEPNLEYRKAMNRNDVEWRAAYFRRLLMTIRHLTAEARHQLKMAEHPDIVAVIRKDAPARNQEGR